MFETDTAKQDSPTAVIEGPPPFIPWRLVEVRVLPDFQLFQRFADGTQGYTHMKDLIFSDHAGVFASLRDPAVFSQVTIDPAFGSAQWANGVDIAPDASHHAIQRDGVQVLR